MSHRPLTACLLMILCSLTSGRLLAQASGSPPPVSADNPGFTNVTEPAAPLALITELALGVSASDGGAVVTLPGVLARIGLAEHLEARAFLPSAEIALPGSGPRDVDADDLALGLLVGGAVNDVLGLSASPVVTLPIGADDTGAQGVEGSLQVNLSWSVLDALGIDVGAAAGWVQVTDSEGQLQVRAHYLGGALITVNLLPDELSLYSELYLDCTRGAGPCGPILGGGAAWWVVPALQLYLATTAPLGDDVVDPGVTLGSVIGW